MWFLIFHYVMYCFIVVSCCIMSMSTTIDHSKQKKKLKDIIYKSSDESLAILKNMFIFTKDGRKLKDDDTYSKDLSEYELNLLEIINTTFSKDNELRYMHVTDELGRYRNQCIIVKKTEKHIFVGIL